MKNIAQEDLPVSKYTKHQKQVAGLLSIVITVIIAQFFMFGAITFVVIFGFFYFVCLKTDPIGWVKRHNPKLW